MTWAVSPARFLTAPPNFGRGADIRGRLPFSKQGGQEPRALALRTLRASALCMGWTSRPTHPYTQIPVRICLQSKAGFLERPGSNSNSRSLGQEQLHPPGSDGP